MVDRVDYPDKEPGDLFTASEATVIKAAINALGTAADRAVGVLSGQIPLLNDSGKLDLAVIPDGLVGGGGTGDVNGPSSSEDGLPVLFDGTSGKQIKAGTAAQLIPSGGSDGQFVQQVSGAAAWVAVTAIRDALAALTTTDRLSYTAIKDLDVAAAGLLYETALLARTEDQQRQFLVGMNGLAFENQSTPAEFSVPIETATAGFFQRKIASPAPVVTFPMWRDGEDPYAFAGILPFLKTLTNQQSMAYAATVTIDYSGSDVDGSGGKCRSLCPLYEITGNISFGSDSAVAPFAGLTGTLINSHIMVEVVNADGGAKTVTTPGSAGSPATWGSMVVTHADGVVNPGIGSTAGDWLKIYWFVKDATRVEILDYKSS